MIDERVREVAASLGIENPLDRRPRQLSRAAPAWRRWAARLCASLQSSLLDEPLSNLDAKLRVEARAFISKLHQRLGTTFIYVTHDQVEAMTMGQRIAVLRAGGDADRHADQLVRSLPPMSSSLASSVARR